jgi:hypothetical protein
MINTRTIVCEEWHKAVKEFRLQPGSIVEKVVGRIINRLDDAMACTTSSVPFMRIAHDRGLEYWLVLAAADIIEKQMPDGDVPRRPLTSAMANSLLSEDDVRAIGAAVVLERERRKRETNGAA